MRAMRWLLMVAVLVAFTGIVGCEQNPGAGAKATAPKGEQKEGEKGAAKIPLGSGKAGTAPPP